MDDTIRDVQDAALAATDTTDAQLLGGHGGAGFRRALGRTLAPDILRRDARAALGASLSGHEAAVESHLAFLETNAGRRNGELIHAAGLAAHDPLGRARALRLGEQRVRGQDPRYLRVMASPDFFDLIGPASRDRVAALRAYYQGFRDSGGFADGDPSIEAMLADLHAMIRQQVEEERMAMTVLWVDEMSLAEVTIIMTYLESPAGVEVVAALDQAAQALSVQNYRDLGLLAGRFVLGSDL